MSNRIYFDASSNSDIAYPKYAIQDKDYPNSDLANCVLAAIARKNMGHARGLRINGYDPYIRKNVYEGLIVRSQRICSVRFTIN